MELARINKHLVIYTLFIFLGALFFAGFVLTVSGYDVPWSVNKPALAGTAQDTTVPTGNSPEGTFFAPNTIEKIVEMAGPAVVKIETTVTQQGSSVNPFFDDPFFREFFGDRFRNPEPRITQGMGSGFLISKDGYILTNNHVVEGADEVKVYLTSRPEPYTAKIIGSDAELDLAIIKIEAGTQLPILKLGDASKIKVGNWVIAIGNPYGLDHTVTVGVISAKGRPVTIEGNVYKDLIQTDASINPGNSGGPLLNLEGEVVGINTAINARAQGIGFAIPSSTVTQVLDQLLEKGKVVRPWMGIIMQPVTEDLARYFGLEKARGALVSAVQDNSPAQKAGLQRGDIILEFNKQEIKTPEDLSKAVNETKIGDKAVLLVHRNKTTIYVTVTIGER